MAAALVVLHLNSFPSIHQWRILSRPAGLQLKAPYEVDADAPPCQRLAGAEDVVVVMRTGATEIKAKLPIHFNTTFKCYPDTLIFSDYAEVFQGHEIHDVLSIVADDVMEANEDFQHYLRLKRLSREGLAQSELHGESLESGPVGKNDNPGWRLDKWKFLPMMVRTLELRPDQKWFIFIEPDTYLVWSNIVQWLQTKDWREDQYLGSEVQIGDDIFAHGGSAFVMSKSAIEKAVEAYQADPEEWHVRTSQHWAGDCILGTALTTVGVDLTWSWPLFQGGNPADMDWQENKAERRLWCSQALSYHHFEAHEVEAMWRFEQQHISDLIGGSATHRRKTVLHHNDMFMQYVVPNITREKSDWTNMSPDLVTNSASMSLDECRLICEDKPGCVQYSQSTFGCSTGQQVKMGRPFTGIGSGWIPARVDRWRRSFHSCRGITGWTTDWS
ncbi:hypothetical protein LTR78_005100 [Recurvomyces mirabilis]|uniref:N-acetylgalactosaminide beta-1,3-galactosyltransferase n=1 Tax=Recurvomyces mirabilis TaxID=574656 RepID=A0AAE1C231_9PEZI|nr:hypothetical protein LTR78_005100 [Recurvomyces mirabilis]KAK5158285.1 hypothetical protein LTS14_003303 [Recurvomyces mirabilis]